MKRLAPFLTLVVLLTVVSEALASAAPPASVATKQRVAIEVKLPLNAPTGTFVLHALTPGQLKGDSGSDAFTNGPTPVFSGRIIGGQRVDRFRGTALLTGKHGTLVIRLRQDC